MDFEINYYKRLISEMIYIKTQENGLNSVNNSECLFSYFNLLSNFFDQKQQHTKTVYLLIILFTPMSTLFLTLWLRNQLETGSDNSNYIF